MWESTGKLTFTATDNATITLTGTGINTRINGERAYTASIVQGNTYTIEWGFSEPQFWLPVLFIIGMLGLGCLMGGPLYIIQKIKEHKYYPDMLNGITITIIGFAFFIAWLWG
jgi:ABC-type antimicrobial peptide transport system permease subunit